MSFRFSIIITTFDTPEYLIECLESFRNLEDVDILVGIDGCEKTKIFLENLEIKTNIRFFYFPSNCGTYVVKNNLIKESKSETILFFDSDDISLPNIFERFDSNYDIIRLKFEEFGNLNNKIENSQGVFFINKEKLCSLNGFQNWKCNADVEFKLRTNYNKFKIKEDDVVSFKRRIHSKNLTLKNDTGMNSDLRKEYESIIKEKFNNSNWDNPKINYVEYYEI